MRPVQSAKPISSSQIIMGIDPGSHHTGFGILRISDSKIQHIEHGVLSAPRSGDFMTRISLLGQNLSVLMARVRPNISVIERIFLGKNADSAFKLGHMRGICVHEALKVQSHVVEYAARSVKKGITGSGAAGKDQVQLLLFAQLKIKTVAQVDASDALALAFHHARMLEIESRFAPQLKRVLDAGL